MEIAVAYKRVPSTAWIAIKTSLDNVFYHNIRSKSSTWEIPQELEDFVLNAFAPPEPELIQEKLLEKQDKAEMLDRLKNMIIDAGLSPFGDWDLEKLKIENESFKELELSEKEKKTVFSEYCKEKAQEEIQARSDNKSLLKEKFFALLDSQNASHQLTWAECQKRYKRHAEFMALPIKEREASFEEWLVLSKERAEKKKADLRNTLLMEFYHLLQDVPQESLILGWKKTRKELEKLDSNFYRKFKSLDDKADLFMDWVKNQGL